jgi:hypothetical protein
MTANKSALFGLLWAALCIASSVVVAVFGADTGTAKTAGQEFPLWSWLLILGAPGVLAAFLPVIVKAWKTFRGQ